MGSNPCRRLQLLGIAHPVEGPLFQVQRLYRRTTLTRARVLEESRGCGFGIRFVEHVLKLLILIFVLVKSNVKTLELFIYS